MLGKAELLDTIVGKNRGILASETDNQAVLAAIANLEDRNPTPRPTEAAELLNGDWQLRYTTSKGLLGIDRVPLINLGQVYQCIRVSENRVYNIAELYGLPYLEGLVSVVARFTIESEKRVSVVFDRSVIGLQRLIRYESPRSFIQQIERGQTFRAIDTRIQNRNQQGWLDITYLDRDLRIGRGNEGSVFVLTKI
jgi:hypothetical protein